MPVFLRLTQVEMGNRLKLYAFFQKPFFNCFVRKVRVKLYDKMQSGVIFYHPAFLFSEAAFYGRKHALALSAIVQSHPVYVLFKIALADKSCQRVLLEGGYRT